MLFLLGLRRTELCTVFAWARFVLDKSGAYSFVPLPPPDDQDILRLAQRLARRVTAFLDHAATAVPAHNRIGLEKLCRYGLRPAFSHERLSLSESGQVLVPGRP